MIIIGNSHKDNRGVITFNNDFDASQIKRMYTIENASTDFIRGWQGHKIEQRWFLAMKGSFAISVLAVDDWKCPSRDLKPCSFIINDATLNVLHVPSGHLTGIQALEDGSRLLAMSDYSLGDIQDEYRFDINYFENHEKR